MILHNAALSPSSWTSGIPLLPCSPRFPTCGGDTPLGVSEGVKVSKLFTESPLASTVSFNRNTCLEIKSIFLSFSSLQETVKELSHPWGLVAFSEALCQKLLLCCGLGLHLSTVAVCLFACFCQKQIKHTSISFLSGKKGKEIIRNSPWLMSVIFRRRHAVKSLAGWKKLLKT